MWYENQPMHVSIREYVTHTVYLLHVSATHMAIFREVHYKGLWDIKVFVLMHRYKILKLYMV
jgi:hypothetical protein